MKTVSLLELYFCWAPISRRSLLQASLTFKINLLRLSASSSGSSGILRSRLRRRLWASGWCGRSRPMQDTREKIWVWRRKRRSLAIRRLLPRLGSILWWLECGKERGSLASGKRRRSKDETCKCWVWGHGEFVLFSAPFLFIVHTFVPVTEKKAAYTGKNHISRIKLLLA